MSYQYYPCEVTDILDEVPGVKRFFLKYPDEFRLQFDPGQFVMLDLPIESKITNRSYSIASAPTSNNVLELLIVLNPGGLGTPYLFNEIRPGSTLMASKPLGKFKLPDQIDRDLFFICTGTGIAPFRSMLQHIIRNNLDFRKITLISGVRYSKDLMYRGEMEHLHREIPGFEYIPVTSRETPDSWKGRTGYVHQVYLERFQEPTDALFYLCGWTAMLREARENLSNLVHDRKQIKFESYD